jgi:hypothetical protein
MSILSSEDKDVTYAFALIKDFFNDIDIYEAIKDTEDLIRSAASRKVYKKRVPGDLLFFKYKFEDLIAAAFAISNSVEERSGAQLNFHEDNASPDIFKQEDFVSKLQNVPSWAAFPRSLTRWQYFDPYKAVKKFAAYMTELEWKKALKVIVDYALTDCPLDDEYPAAALLTIRLRMLQLIEASHLLHVRTNLEEKSTGKKIPKQKKK